MSKSIRYFVLLGLTSLICGLSASPFWFNQCSHQLSEAEKDYLIRKRLALIKRHWNGVRELNPTELQEKTDEYRHRLDEAYIPCVSSDLSPEEKEEAGRRRLGVLDLLYDEPGAFPLPVRVDLEYVRRNRDTAQSYHYVGYTVFYVQVFRAYSGGSGAVGICAFSSECVIK